MLTVTPALSTYWCLSSLQSDAILSGLVNQSRPTLSYIEFQMSNQEYKYFYEDEVYRITKKGSLQFGMVVENVRRISLIFFF